MKFLYLCLLSPSLQFTLTFLQDESLCLNYKGQMVSKAKECDDFDANGIALLKASTKEKFCWNKDMKGFHICSRRETDYVEKNTLSDSLYGWISRKNDPMKYTASGKWVNVEFGERTGLESNTRFWG